MKLLLLFFTQLLILIPKISTTPCTTTDQIRFLQCKGAILKIQEMLKEHAPRGDTIPPQSIFKKISRLCNKALKCVEEIECVEAKRGVSMMTSACGGIEMSAGPFGDCMSKLQLNPPDIHKYPCATMFHTDSLDSKYKRCQLLTEHVECVSSLSLEQCGQSASDAFKKGVDSMKTLLKC